MPDIDSLTIRQREVLERIGRGQQNKTIAAELDLSSTRVEQHISRLKLVFEVNSRAELAAIWLDSAQQIPPLGDTQGAKTQVPHPGELPQRPVRDNAGEIGFSDAIVLDFAPHWEADSIPRVVPERLDGPDATKQRLFEIGKLVLGIMMVVVLGLAMLSSIGDVLG